jgi:predicted peroxiredoxin
MGTVAIVCNSCEPQNVFPTFIVGSAAAAMGDEVVLFFTPSAAPALVRGRLEKMQAKGMPPMAELVTGFQDLEGKILACDLCLEAKDLAPGDLRDGVELVGVVPFLAGTRDAARTFCF